MTNNKITKEVTASSLLIQSNTDLSLITALLSVLQLISPYIYFHKELEYSQSVKPHSVVEDRQRSLPCSARRRRDSWSMENRRDDFQNFTQFRFIVKAVESNQGGKQSLAWQSAQVNWVKSTIVV